MDSLFKSIKFKLNFLCIIVLSIIIVAIHVAVYMTAMIAIEVELEMVARGVAVSIANTLRENAAEYKEFLETKDTDSEYYRRMQAYFANIKANSNIKYIYTERRIDAEKIEFILDAEPVESPDYSPPGAINPNDMFRESAYSTAQPVYFKPKYSGWGYLLGAYAPIFDANGEMLGLIGVNIDASIIYQHLNRLQTTMLIIYLLLIVLAILALRKYSDTILKPILKDKLTGTYNMRFFEKYIQKTIRDCIKKHSDLALLMIDIDHFKKVNDAYGHGFGDTALRIVAKTIIGCLRKTDYLFRYGGEEFLLMIANTDIKIVADVAERIRANVETKEIINKEMNSSVNVTLSIGISHLQTQYGLDSDSLLEKADKALYHAKIKRNCVSLFDDIYFSEYK
jgi:diguanylate cyclase (GGDEF)-like protein